MKSVWPWLLAVSSGILLASCFAPFDQDWLAWVGLTPLIAAAWFGPPWRRHDWLRVLGLGYACGLAFFLISLFWLTNVTWPGWFLLACYLATYLAVWALYVGKAGRPVQPPGDERPIWTRSLSNLGLAATSAAAWTGLEWLRGTLLSGFGWNSLGVSQHQQIALIQITDITGVGGLSFLIVMANVMAVMTVRRFQAETGRRWIQPHYDVSITIGLVALTFVYGVRQLSLPKPESLELKVAAVQPNIPILVKLDARAETHIMGELRRLTEVATELKPDLIVWPEAATPRAALNYEDMAEQVVEMYRGHGKDFLLGTVYYDATGDFNGAALLTPSSGPQIYKKIHLVPFGEFIPFRSSFPLFAWVIGDLVPDDFDAGTDAGVVILSTKSIRAAALVCFEDTLGGLARMFLHSGAQLFVNVTNDSWFGKSAGSRQHLANAIFRCPENHIPMVRAANTGVTCFVDRFGRVTQQLAAPNGNTFIDGVLAGTIEVPNQTPVTFYSSYGDLFSIACLLAALIALKPAILRARPA